MSAPLLVSRKQAAEALGVSVPTLCTLIQRGMLRPVRIGSRVLLPWSELQRFAEDGTLVVHQDDARVAGVEVSALKASPSSHPGFCACSRKEVTTGESTPAQQVLKAGLGK